MRVKTILVSAGLLVLGAAAGVYVQSKSVVDRSASQTAAAVKETLPSTEPAPKQAVETTPLSAPAVHSNSSPEIQDIIDSCNINEEQLKSHPLYAEELRRTAPLKTNIPELGAYRGLPLDSIEKLAAAGDSLAMAAAGYAELQLASGINTIDPVDFHDNIGEFTSPLGNKRDRAAIDHLDRASYWLYEAALHGRVSAYADLQSVNRARFGSVTNQGLLDEQDVSASGKKAWLVEEFVHNRVFGNIAPQLLVTTEGYMEARVFRKELEVDPDQFLADNPNIQAAIDQQVEIFQRDREEAGLEAIEISPPRIPIEEMIAEICSQ